MKRTILAVGVLLITSTLFAQHRIQRDTIRSNGKVVGVTVTNWYCTEGDTCPSFTVYDENGRTINSDDLRGKTVVISFWISSCGPCRMELRRVGPEIIDRYSPDEFVFLAIGNQESAENAQKIRKLSKATFPLCYEPTGKVYKLFADQGFPKTFVVDAQGIVRLAEKGYNEKKFNHLKEVVHQLVLKNRK